MVVMMMMMMMMMRSCMCVWSTAALSVGKLLGYWNIPYLSFSSIDPQLADKKTHNTLIRMMSPFNHMASALGQICANFSVSLSVSVCLSVCPQMVWRATFFRLRLETALFQHGAPAVVVERIQP